LRGIRLAFLLSMADFEYSIPDLRTLLKKGVLVFAALSPPSPEGLG
jgi:hypothetical protein